MKNTIRIATTLGVLAAAVASQAVVLNFVGQTPSGITAATTAFTTTGALNLSGVPYNAIATGAVTGIGSANSQVILYAGTAASNTGSLTITFDGTQDFSSPGTGTFSALGTITGSSGVLATVLPGQVTVASNSNFTGGFNTFSVNGNLNPVPEPSAFAAIGLGAVALVRRRRKA